MREQGSARFPFVVALDSVRTEAPVQQDDEPGAIPAQFPADSELRARIAYALARSGLFTRVLASKPPEAEDSLQPDVLLDVELRGSDFGAGHPALGPAVFSTVAWLFVGPLSWLIEDREYSEGEVELALHLSFPEALRPSDTPEWSPQIYDNVFLVQGLRLSLLERGGLGDWFANILLPPWAGDGEPEKAGARLGQKVVEFVAERCEEFFRNVDDSYLRETDAYLIQDTPSGHLLVVSRDNLVQLELSRPQSTSESVTLDSDARRDLMVGLDERPDRPDVDDLVRRSLPALARHKREWFAYEFGLPELLRMAPRGRGLIRIAVTVGDAGKRAQWTIDPGEDAWWTDVEGSDPGAPAAEVTRAPR